VREDKQVAGILRSSNALRQHGVIARALAVESRLSRGKPGERVEPVKCNDESRQKVPCGVEPRDVRQFVHEDRIETTRMFFGPPLGASG
jgi:hypothetical protein